MAGLPSSIRWPEVQPALPGRPPPLLLASAQRSASRWAHHHGSRLHGSLSLSTGRGGPGTIGWHCQSSLAGHPSPPLGPMASTDHRAQALRESSSGSPGSSLGRCTAASRRVARSGWHGRPPPPLPSSSVWRPTRVVGLATSWEPLSHGSLPLHYLSLSSPVGGQDLPVMASFGGGASVTVTVAMGRRGKRTKAREGGGRGETKGRGDRLKARCTPGSARMAARAAASARRCGAERPR